MLPHQRNKVDISSLSAEEQKLFRLYGKLPSKKDILKNKLKERKYFDSGDYALSKAGKASDVGVTNIGSQHPLPENIPHIHSTPNASDPSPVKEHTHLRSSPMAGEAPVTAEELEAAAAAAEEETKVEEKAEAVAELDKEEQLVEVREG
ncbi:camp-regulated phospho protein/endosulfine conserved region-domain-containing protein [Sphaerosporella brunnea]|uniref:mRNA stability protein n=1 Tax=Sphaerosporella brunnea TaxID=1250544 RepID=A0A5J5EZL6_9PEZI|nr:camp-regulated phospho protein/endosulfine conserved region-domain-containing protein [Sphaerosporella brunnea]